MLSNFNFCIFKVIFFLSREFGKEQSNDERDINWKIKFDWSTFLGGETKMLTYTHSLGILVIIMVNKSNFSHLSFV